MAINVISHQSNAHRATMRTASRAQGWPPSRRRVAGAGEDWRDGDLVPLQGKSKGTVACRTLRVVPRVTLDPASPRLGLRPHETWKLPVHTKQPDREC